jgi:hypothetical protein
MTCSHRTTFPTTVLPSPRSGCSPGIAPPQPRGTIQSLARWLQSNISITNINQELFVVITPLSPQHFFPALGQAAQPAWHRRNSGARSRLSGGEIKPSPSPDHSKLSHGAQPRHTSRQYFIRVGAKCLLSTACLSCRNCFRGVHAEMGRESEMRRSVGADRMAACRAGVPACDGIKSTAACGGLSCCLLWCWLLF